MAGSADIGVGWPVPFATHSARVRDATYDRGIRRACGA